MRLFAKSEIVPLPSECKKLIFLNALFQGGRLFVGAVCVLYFLSFGLQAGDYAWIKTTQAIIFIGCDIPLGYLLNRIGEYKSLLLALCFGVVGSLGYLLCTNLAGFLISEIFLALSLSIWPVALSAYSMRVLKNHAVDGLIEKFFHFGDAVSNMFVLICGSLGGVLYAFKKYFPYGCFLLFYLLACVFVLFFLKNLEVINSERKNNIKLFVSDFKEMWALIPVASIIFLAQFLMQPLFHYWQPLFSEHFNIGSREMAIIFIVYSLSMTSISWGYSRMTQLSGLRTNLFVLSIAIIGSVCYSLVARSNIFIISMIFFALSFGFFNLVQIAGGVLIQNKLNHSNRMVLIKYVSFYSRMGMVLSLFLLHWMFANGWTSIEVYKLYGLIAFGAFSLYVAFIIMKKNAEKKYVS